MPSPFLAPNPVSSWDTPQPRLLQQNARSLLLMLRVKALCSAYTYRRAVLPVLIAVMFVSLTRHYKAIQRPMQPGKDPRQIFNQAVEKGKEGAVVLTMMLQAYLTADGG